MRPIMDGKAVAERIKQNLKDDVEGMACVPVLSVIQIGNDPASEVYIRNKKKAAEQIGITMHHLHLNENVSMDYLKTIVHSIEEYSDGIILQRPVPEHLKCDYISELIDDAWDVDGFRPDSRYTPCTPLGILTLLRHYGVPLAGKHAVIVGRSDIVGKPMAKLLLEQNCTVTVCHSKTENLAQHTRRADILISAVGKPGLITFEMVNPSAVVIDVGINRVDGKLVGDVAPEVMAFGDGLITPVPGGVGPMTVAALMANVVNSANR